MEAKQVEVQMDSLEMDISTLVNIKNDSSSDSSVPPAAELSPAFLSSPGSLPSDNTFEEDFNQEASLLREWAPVPLTEEEAFSAAPKAEKGSKVTDYLRKGAVAVTGGALVAAGIPLIPCPTPGGVVVVGSGMALLATEFPAAQRALDKSREGLENMVRESDDEGEDGEIKKNRSGGTYKSICADTDEVGHDCKSDSEMISPNSKRRQGRKYGLLGSGNTPMPLENRMKADLNQAMKNVKQGKRSVKKFVRNNVLPIMTKVTKK